MTINHSLISEYIKDYSTSDEVVKALFNFVIDKYESNFENDISDSEFSYIVPDDLEQQVVDALASSEKWGRGSDYFWLEKKYLSNY